jgi:hypothetical protein
MVCALVAEPVTHLAHLGVWNFGAVGAPLSSFLGAGGVGLSARRRSGLVVRAFEPALGDFVDGGKRFRVGGARA